MSALVQGLNAQLRKAAGIDLDLLKFLLKQRLVGFEVAEAPFFDTEETTEWFVEQLRKSKKYLEYGSGGSTYVAAKLGVRFIAVESDPYFLKSVQRKIRADGHARDVGQTYRYADIGLTEYVGYPLRPWRASERRVAKFRRYSDPPPQCFEDGTLPDLVLVDGRFRVACALKALRMLQNELFDLGSELATPVDAVYEGMFRVGPTEVAALERLIELKVHGIDPDMLQELRAAGLKIEK